VGNWRLTRRLGEGAFGAVYEAENAAIAGKRAAVKILHPHLAVNADLKRRFINEASAASRAEHENLIQIFDGGITPDGTCYLVMEFLRGRTLAAALEQDGALGVARSVAIVAQIAAGLAAAHDLGIVHRDLKPENIFLLSRPTQPDFVKVLDFGIAKLSGDLDVGGGGATRTGTLLGTPAYMSPE
jgi:serine/threonine-protein kinase